MTDHSPLQSEIRRLIKSSGPMPVWRYMELCLMHPQHGYYIARDPLDPQFDDDEFVRTVRKRTSGVKRQLLNQNLISGVGNIYADEALWRARIHGERPGDRLTAAQVREPGAISSTWPSPGIE